MYLSEISHHFNNNSYFYGGGYYYRGNIKYGYTANEIIEINEFNSKNIDYYLSSKEKISIFSPIILCFRTQMFVTRSDVVIISGIRKNNPEIIGRYTSRGDKIE